MPATKAAAVPEGEIVNPELTVIYRNPKDLIPNPTNARVHTAETVNELAGAIQMFGWTNPILIDYTDMIFAGHRRQLAAIMLKLRSVPCIDISHLSPDMRRAAMLADNRIALNASWDLEMLGNELRDLANMDMDLKALGFDQDEIDEAMGALGEENREGEDEAPDVEPENVISKPGDVWLLGKHRLMCGDSTSADDVGVLLAGVEPHLMVTDPPYGVSYDANWRNEADRANGKAYGARAIGKVTNDDRADWSEAYTLFPGDVAYVWHPPGATSVQFFDDLTKCGFDVRMQIIWSKSHFPIGRGNYHVQHEPCWYAVRKGANGHWAGDRKQSTIWNIDKPMKSETGHSTQKPVECMRRPMVNNAKAGDSVYDPFVGSGTSIIAAETTGRHCYAMEVHPAYVDLCVRRWQEFTGEDATHEETGDPFDDGVDRAA